VLIKWGNQLEIKENSWKTFLFLGLIFAVTYFIPFPPVFHSLIFIIYSLISTLLIFFGIFIYRPKPLFAWMLIGFGQFFNFSGDITGKISYFYPSFIKLTTISLNSYFLGLACFFIGLCWLFFNLRKNIRRSHIIYGVISTIGIATFLWVTLISPNLNLLSHADNWFEIIVFPAGLLIIGVIGSIFLLTPIGESWSLKFLFIGLIFNAIALNFYFGLESQRLLLMPGSIDWPMIFNDVSYSMAYLFFGIAFIHPSIKLISTHISNIETQVTRQDLIILGTAFFLPPLGLFLVHPKGLTADVLLVLGAMIIIFMLVEWRLEKVVRFLEIENSHLFSQQAKLEYQALHDALTGLPNRLFLSRYFTDLNLRRDLQKFPVAVFLIDLNKFKNVNDQLGHDKGDRVLKEISKQLATFSRKRDFLGRWGGDEFLFVLEDITRMDALAFARRLFKEVRVNIKAGKAQFDVDISIGICMIIDKQLDLPTIINQSDFALYQAKASLNERVAIYSAENLVN
jgi:diguanylate cyclase (GGDEF)-like protein